MADVHKIVKTLLESRSNLDRITNQIERKLSRSGINYKLQKNIADRVFQVKTYKLVFDGNVIDIKKGNKIIDTFGVSMLDRALDTFEELLESKSERVHENIEARIRDLINKQSREASIITYIEKRMKRLGFKTRLRLDRNRPVIITVITNNNREFQIVFDDKELSILSNKRTIEKFDISTGDPMNTVIKALDTFEKLAA